MIHLSIQLLGHISLFQVVGHRVWPVAPIGQCKQTENIVSITELTEAQPGLVIQLQYPANFDTMTPVAKRQ